VTCNQDGTTLVAIPNLLSIESSQKGTEAILRWHPFLEGNFTASIHSTHVKCVATDSDGIIASHCIHIKARKEFHAKQAAKGMQKQAIHFARWFAHLNS
jgi:hypothetical protein